MTMRTATRPFTRALGSSLTGLLLLAIQFPIPTARGALVPGVLPDAAPESLLVLLAPRSTEAIQQEMSAADVMEDAAKRDLESAQGKLAEAKAAVNVRKSEIETLKAKIKLAEEQKNETEKADLAQQVKAKELQVKVLEARVEMREAEAGLANARREAAQTQSAFHKKERELIEKRNELVKLQAAPEGAANLDGLIKLRNEVRDLERRSLEVLKDAANKSRNAAEHEARVVDQRLKLQERQKGLIGGAEK